MPDNTRRDIPTTQSFTLGDRRFVGIDTNLPPNMLDVGFLQDVENLFVDGGALTPRPGWNRRATLGAGTPVYSLTPYRTADNVANQVYFVSGSSVYSWNAQTFSISSAITSSGTWTDASKVRLKQHGKYIYGVPGDTGTAMFRIDGSVTPATYETIPQLSAPTRDGVVYIKPKVTAVPNNIKTIGTQVRTVFASIPGTGATDTFTADNNFLDGQVVRVASAIGANFAVDTDYLIYARTATTFKLVLPSAPTTPRTNSTGAIAYTHVVRYDNQIDDYYTYKGLNAFTKTTQTGWPSTWSNNLFKLTKNAGFSTYKSIPSGDFDGYANNLVIGNDPLTDAFTGSGCSIRQFYSDTANTIPIFEYRKGGTWSGSSLVNQYIITPQSSQYPEWTAYSGETIKAMMCDGNTEYFQQDILNLPKETWAPSTTATTIGLYYYTFWHFNNSTDQESVAQSAKFAVEVKGLDADGNPISGAIWAQTYEAGAPQSNSDWKKREIIIDFRQFASSLNRIRIKIQSLVASNQRHQFFTRCRLYAIASVPTASLEKTEATDANGFNMVRAYQANTNIQPAYATNLDNRRIRIFCQNDSGTTLDISDVGALSFQWAWHSSLKLPDGSYPNVTLGVGNGSTILWSSIGEYDADNKYMTFKLYTLQKSEKTNIDFLYIRFDDDVKVYGANDVTGNQGIQGTPLFSIGNMTSDIGLSDSSTYEYAFTRWYPSSASAVGPDVLLADGSYSKGFETPLSDISDSISTTSALARAAVILNPNDSAGYGSNVCIDKLKLTAVSDTADLDQYVSTRVPGASQIAIITNSSSPSFKYFPITGSEVTLSAGSFSTITAPDGTTYKKYVIPASDANRIKYVSTTQTVAFSSTNSYWLEHYVPYGYGTATKYSHVCVYRRNNNLFPDGRFRLIAVVPVSDAGSATPSGDGWTASYNNATSREITLTDGVPDGNVLYQSTPYAQGWFYEIARDNLPLRASCITTFQNRLWVSKDNQVFASWTIDQTDEHKIYTSFLPDLSEPGVQKKGFTFSVGGRQEKEVVRALLPVFSDGIVQSNTTSSTMLVLKENSVSTIIGFDPTTFNVQSWISTQGVGISAPQTAVNALGQLLWLGVNGVNQWTGAGVANKSLPLRKLLSLDPTMQGPTIDKAYYQQSISTIANNRLYLLSTASGAASANTKVYVFDGMVGGWVKWSLPSGVSFTSISTLSFGDDLQYIIAADTAGRIYRLEGAVDNVTGTDLPISWSLTTRQHAQTYSEAPTYYQYNRPYQLDLHVQNTSAYRTTPGNLPFLVNWHVENQSGVYNAVSNPDGVSVSGSYAFPFSTNRAVAIRNLGRDVKGAALQVRLSGDSTGLFHIRAIHIHVYDGGIRR